MYIELQICYEQIRHYQLKYIQCTYFVFTFQITGSEGQTEDGKGCGDGRRRDHEWTILTGGMVNLTLLIIYVYTFQGTTGWEDQTEDGKGYGGGIHRDHG